MKINAQTFFCLGFFVYISTVIDNKANMKAPKHYAEWPIEESLRFLNLYLDGVRNTDHSILCKNIANDLGRTVNAIKLRVLEVNRICGGEREFPEITPNMAKAVDLIIKERNVSATRLSMLF